MKSTTSLRWFSISCLALVATGLLISRPAAAQGPMGMGGQPAGMKAAFAKLFGSHTAFTAQADMKVQDKSGKESMAMIMDMSMLEGKLRTDLDMAKMKNDQMPPMAIASLKQMGMDRMTTIIRPDQKKMLVVYPSLKAYTEMPISEDEAQAIQKSPKIELTEVGKETVDGHPCVKKKFVITDDQGGKQEGFIWHATDLKDFPVKMESSEDGATVTMLYKGIQTAKPDAAKFDAPAGFAKHGSIQELMQSAAMKNLGGAGKN